MKQATNHRLSHRVTDYILSRETEELASLTGSKIAETLGIDLSDLVHTFKTHQKITPDEFILREKMYRSLSLLDKDHEISIPELAKKMGFPKIERFTGEFKNYLLIEPQKYKELLNR